MRSRVNKTPARAPDQAADIVSAYLTSTNEGDLKAASCFLGNNFEMTCPGNIKFKALAEFSEWTQNRYSKVLKNILSKNVSFRGLDSTVFFHGTLSGTWHNGYDFSDVRFIDRFDVSEGLINSQEIWNDLTLQDY